MRRNETYRRYWDDEPDLGGLLAPAAPIAPTPAAPVQQPTNAVADFLRLYDGMSGSFFDGTNNSLYNSMSGDLARMTGFQGPAMLPTTFQQEMANEGGTVMADVQGQKINPALVEALRGYQVDQRPGEYKAGLLDSAGQSVGTFRTGDEPSKFDKFANVAIPLAIAAIGGPALAAGFGGGITGGALAGGTLGGINAGMNDGNVLKGMLTGGLTGGALAGISGAMQAPAATPSFFDQGASFLGETVPQAAPWTTGLGSIAGDLAPAVSPSLLGPSFLGETVPQALSAPSAPSFFDQGAQFLGEQVQQPAPWKTGLGATAGDLSPVTLDVPSYIQPPAPSTSFFEPGAQFLGQPVQPAAPMQTNPLSPWDITPAEPIQASFEPVSLAPQPPASGLSDFRKAELENYQTDGTVAKPATTTGPNAMESITATAGQAGNALRDLPGVQWMKDNPLLGRLLMGGATSLLSMSGGGSSGPQASAGPAKQWNSPLQGGLLGSVQQAAPSTWARQQPAGLLAQGSPYDGAWRYLKG